MRNVLIGRNVKNRNGSVSANRDNVTFLKALTTGGCFHKAGKYCCDKFRLKAYFRTGTKENLRTALYNKASDVIKCERFSPGRLKAYQILGWRNRR